MSDADCDDSMRALHIYKHLLPLMLRVGTMGSDIARWAAADHDDRVVPLHSYKFLATLQHTLAGYPGSPQRNPLLLRVDTNAGHGGGAPLARCSTDLVLLVRVLEGRA